MFVKKIRMFLSALTKNRTYLRQHLSCNTRNFNVKVNKACPGCGAKFHQSNSSQPGYLPLIAQKISVSEEMLDSLRKKNEPLTVKEAKMLLTKPEPIICSKCHSLRHHQGAHRSQSLKTNMMQFAELKMQTGGLVVMIIDLLDPLGTLIKNIDEYTGEKDILLVLNKSVRYRANAGLDASEFSISQIQKLAPKANTL
jgi:hypothetical protein